MMRLSGSARRGLETVPLAIGLGILAGLGFDVLFGISDAAASAIIGAGVGFFVFGYERGLLFPRVREQVRRLSTPVYLLLSFVILLALLTIGRSAGVLAVWSLGLHEAAMPNALMVPRGSILYGLAISFLVTGFFRVRDVVGPGTLVNLFIGRYHRPIAEDRIFLFIDLVGSTAFADRHGDIAAQDLLGRVFAAMADPVRRARGQIDDYIGDLVMISWPLARGLRDGRCVACVFDILATIEAGAAEWTHRYGLVPSFRAALHCGRVVTAEIGVERHKIAYFGDVLNTTARMETLTRQVDAPILISKDLLGRLETLPDGIVAEPLGEHALRGRDQPLGIVALRWAGGPAAGQHV